MARAPVSNEKHVGRLLVDPAEKLGDITSPSGTIIILDMGLMYLWTHDEPPMLPEGLLSSGDKRQDANNVRDLRVVGQDARVAGIAYDRSCHPLYIYDIPESAVADKIEHFAAFARDNNFDANAEVLPGRVTHRERINRLLEDGVAANGIEFHGIWAAVATKLPKNKPLAVYGQRRAEGTEFAGRWHEVYVEVEPDGDAVRSEMLGHAAVDEARLMFADADALGAWVHDAALDGKADFAFWGADAEAAARETRANELGDGAFGWRDLPVDELVARGTEVERLRDERDWRYATDFRPHSHHWWVMEQVRASVTESGTITVGGADLCAFMTSWGDGLFAVYGDYDEEDRLLRIRVALGSEQTLKRMRSVHERYFGEFAEMAFASNRVFEDGQCVRFMYREEPDREQDSGWRVFAGGESDDFANNPANVSVVPLRDLLEQDPALEELFRKPVGSVFERESCADAFSVVTDWDRD